MKNLNATLCLTLALLPGSVGMSWSTDFQKNGFATALREWVPLAEQRDTEAQSSPGLRYDKEQETPQGHVQTHMWLNLAATNKEMRPADISIAERLTNEPTRKQYKGC